MEIQKVKSRVWTAVYFGNCGCYHEIFGEESGPKLSFNTAVALAEAYFKKHRKSEGLHNLHSIFPAHYRDRHNVSQWHMFKGY